MSQALSRQWFDDSFEKQNPTYYDDIEMISEKSIPTPQPVSKPKLESPKMYKFN